MKNRLLFLKKFFLLLLLIGVSELTAQNTCINAIPDTATNDCKEKLHYFNNSNDYWVKFVATSNHIFIKIGDSLQQINPINSIALFEGSCDSLVMINSSNSENKIDDTTLLLDSEYYIRVSRTQQSSLPFSLLLKNSTQTVYPSFTIVGSSSTCCYGSVIIQNLTPQNPTTGFYSFQTYPNVVGLVAIWAAASPPTYPGFPYNGTYELQIPPSVCQNLNNYPFTAPSYTQDLRMFYSGNTCDNYHSLSITVYPRPQITISPSNPVICPGTSTTLTANGASTYLWQPGNITGSSITVQPIVNTTYTVTGTSQYGCTESTTITVTMDQSFPHATVNNEVIDCGDCATLTVSGTNIGSYLWSTGETTASIYVCPNGTTQYTVTVTNALGCNPRVLTATVTIPPSPAKPELEYFVNNTCGEGQHTYPYCVKDPITTMGYNYQWLITSTNPLSYPTPGTFNGGISTGSCVNITWNDANIPPLPGYAILRLTVTDNHKCSSFEEFHIFQCCEGPWGEDPPMDLITLNNTDAVSGLNSNNYTGTTFLINGNFFVNKNLTIHSSEIKFGPEAQIIIEPEYDLVIDNTSLLDQGCGFMWKGIIVDNASSSLFVDGSTIKDAYTSIQAKNKAFLDITNNIFSNNNVGIQMKDYINPSNNTVKIIGNRFNSHILIGNISFYPPYNLPYKKPFAGIEVLHCNNITIGKENIGSVVNTNRFQTLYNGIRSKNSEINVYNNTFTDIQASFGGIGIHGINEPMGVGIYSANTIINHPIGFATQGITIGSSVDKANSFTDCFYGVYLHNNRHFLVSLNTFDNNYSAINASEIFHFTGSKIIFYNTIDNVKYCGIALKSMKNCMTQFNEISNITAIPVNQTSPNLRRYGINAKGCNKTTIYGNRIINTTATTDLRLEGISVQGGDYYVACNTIEKIGKALNFYGNSPSMIEMNQMVNTPYGIYLNHGFIGDQGSEGHPSDNKWISPSNFIEHTYTTQNSTVSNMYLRGYSNPLWFNYFYPNPMTNGSSGLQFLNPIGTSGFGHNCKETQSVGLQFALNKEAGEMIAKKNITFEEYEDNNQWMSEFALFNDLYDENPDSLNNWMVDFMNNCDENYKSLAMIDGEFCEEDYNGAKDFIDEFSAKTKPAAIMLDIYRMITETTLRENNASDEILFYDYQVKYLRDIASQCPYEFGNSVYLARLLLSVIEPTIYVNECEDVIEERNFTKPKTGNNTPQVKVYPNPAHDEFTIELDGDVNGKNIEVKLFTLYGNMVKTIKDGSVNKLTINTQELSAGIYFYSVAVDNTIIGKDKIVIIK
ncbi:MAG: T9SS type A sorting domain-containing protein [Bacteroidota bacterium]